MPWRKADYSMEHIAQAPIIKSQDAVLARPKPDRSRRHGRIEHSDAASHKTSMAALLQVAYIEDSRIRENSVKFPVGSPNSHESGYRKTARCCSCDGQRLAATVDKACQTAQQIFCVSAGTRKKQSLFLPEITAVIRYQCCLELFCNNVCKPIQPSCRQMTDVGKVLDVF